MKNKRLKKSIRKFIRLQKARIRREVLVSKEQEKQINELYQKIKDQTQKTKNKVKTQKTKNKEQKSKKQSIKL